MPKTSGRIKKIWEKEIQTRKGPSRMHFVKLLNSERVFSDFGEKPSNLDEGMDIEIIYKDAGKFSNIQTITIVDSDKEKAQPSTPEDTQKPLNVGDKPNIQSADSISKQDSILYDKLGLVLKCKNEIESLYGMSTKEHPELIEIQTALFKSVNWGDLK